MQGVSNIAFLTEWVVLLKGYLRGWRNVR